MRALAEACRDPQHALKKLCQPCQHGTRLTDMLQSRCPPLPPLRITCLVLASSVRAPVWLLGGWRGACVGEEASKKADDETPKKHVFLSGTGDNCSERYCAA